MSVYTHGLRPEQIDDLVENTLRHFEKDKFVDLALDLQQYFAMENMLLGKRIGYQGGEQLQWQVKVRNTGSAKNTGLYAVDNVKVADVTRHCNVPWTKQTANMAYDVDEPLFNRPTAQRILDMIKVRRHDALSSFAELMEENFWGLPENTTDEEELLKPRGVPYYIVRNATKGFNGSLPIGGGHSTVAGLSPTTYPNHRNWTDQYDEISKQGLVRSLREACVKCKFKPPVPHASPVSGDPSYVLPTVYPVISKLEEILELQNQNLGNDVASKDGELLFRKIPMVWVPYLEEVHDTTAADATNHYGKNPVYGINKKSFRCVFQTGRFMRRSKPMVAPNQHTVRHIHWDSWMQFQCFERRSNFVVTQSA